MSDFQAAMLAAVLIAVAALVGWYLHLARAQMKRPHMTRLDYPLQVCCRASAPRLYALRQIFESMPTDAETTDRQIEEMAATIDELMQIWIAKPSQTIVQASQSVVAIRWASQSNFSQRSK